MEPGTFDYRRPVGRRRDRARARLTPGRRSRTRTQPDAPRIGEKPADVGSGSAYTLAYDAARRALAAVLQNQGLRATSRGGHRAVYEAVLAQLDPPLGAILRPFNRMRARRNEIEYRSSETPTVTSTEITADLPKVQALIGLAEKAIPNMPRY